MEAYPLHWPVGRPRTQRSERSRFDVGAAQARDDLLNEVRLLGGGNMVISTNIPLRNDGLPYAKYHGKEPEDTGVAVYFSYKGQPMCFSCDRWDKVRDNMRAIQKTIAAMRGIVRWGTGDMVQQTFTGFALLEAPKKHLWYEVLKCYCDASPEDVKLSYRTMLKATHPDHGGSAEAFQEVQEAWKEYCGLKGENHSSTTKGTKR
jgi:hypothetical protein